MNNIKRVPIFFITMIIVTLAFTFVNYVWIMSVAGRFFYALAVVVFGLLSTAMNNDLKFWVYKR